MDILLKVQETDLTLESHLTLVATQVNYAVCKFTFGPEWDDYTKTAVFYTNTNEKKVAMLLDDDNKCFIPWEVVQGLGSLYVGVFGVKGNIVIPTNFIVIRTVPGAAGNKAPDPPTVAIYEQILAYILELKADIITGIDLHDTLQSDISIGTPLEALLKADLTIGVPLDVSLKASISTGTPLDASIKAGISTGTPLDASLKADISTGTPLDVLLKADIILANGSMFATEVKDARLGLPSLMAVLEDTLQQEEFTEEIVEITNDLNPLLKGEFDRVDTSLANNVSQLNDNSAKILTLSSGTPRTNYATLALLQAGIPNGDIYSYVCTDGHRYYYNAGWQDGGIYQGTIPNDGSVSKDTLNADLQMKFFTEISKAQENIYKKTYLNSALNDKYVATFCGFSVIVTPPNKYISKISGSFKAGIACTLVCEVRRGTPYGTLLGTVEAPYTSSTQAYQTIDFVLNNLNVSTETKLAISVFVKDKTTWLSYADITGNVSDFVISATGGFNNYLTTSSNWTTCDATNHYKFCMILDIYAIEQVINVDNLQSEVDVVKNDVADLIDSQFKMNYIYVSDSYTIADEEFGITKFDDMWVANNYISSNSKTNRYTLISDKTIDIDLQTRFSNVRGTYYQGVTCKDYCYYESANIDRPDLYSINWDGATGFTSPVTADVINKSPFHVIGTSLHGIHTHVKGFTFNCKNLRYAYHAETQSFGLGVDWLLEKCVLNWGGRVGMSDNSGVTPVIGLGSSPFEKGKIYQCKLTNTEVNNKAGIQNHNNAFGNYGYTPYMVCGSKIDIENCNLNGLNIEFRSGYDGIYDTSDVVEIKGCVNVNHAYFGFINPATVQNWKASISASKITTNDMI